MNEPDIHIQDTASANDLRGECEDLRRQVNLLFGGLLVASLTLTAFLGLQARRASAELAAVKPQAEQLLKAVQRDDAGAQATFAKLLEFARTHPDFADKVLSKYKVNTNAPAAAPKK
jgi:hypothetical protein